jgi:hypothetical protein
MSMFKLSVEKNPDGFNLENLIWGIIRTVILGLLFYFIARLVGEPLSGRQLSIFMIIFLVQSAIKFRAKVNFL